MAEKLRSPGFNTGVYFNGELYNRVKEKLGNRSLSNLINELLQLWLDTKS